MYFENKKYMPCQTNNKLSKSEFSNFSIKTNADQSPVKDVNDHEHIQWLTNMVVSLCVCLLYF